MNYKQSRQIIMFVQLIQIKFKQMMRKNLSKQQLKRNWRTPSPSIYYNIQSPRNFNKQPAFNLQSSKQQQKNYSKSKPMLSNLKNQLHQLKQQVNKMPSNLSYLKLSNYNKHNEFIIKDQQQNDADQVENKHNGQLHHNYQNNINDSNQLNCYNEYFNKISSMHSNMIKDNNSTKSTKSIKQVISKTQQRRGNQVNSIKDKQKQKFKFFSILNRNYRQNKKYIEQIQQLKTNYNKLQDSHALILQQKKKIQIQLSKAKVQLLKLKNKYEQKKQKQLLLDQNVISLKDQLQQTIKQLNNSNKEIYHMKQEYFELQINYQKQKLELERVLPLKKSQNIKKINQINVCQNCKMDRKLIAYLNSSNQNKSLELSKKSNAIQNLCNDVQKLKNELRIFENPKATIKKFGNVLQLVNQMVILDKIKCLNSKYEFFC